MAPQPQPSQRALPTWLFLGGLGALFIGERLIGAGPTRGISALGALLVLAAVVLRALRFAQAAGDRKAAERTQLAFALLGAFALVLYVFQSDLATTLLDRPLERSSPRLAAVLAALWPALLLASVLPTIFVELAWSAVARAPRLELERIRDAAFTGLGLAGALTFAIAAVYVATQRDLKLDLSYFRTARPGESTRKIVQALDAPLDVAIFYPPASEVREEVEGYFADLAKESPELKVATYDNAVDIAKAKELNVTANGMVVISRGGRKETLNIGLELEQARSPLRNLDKDVQKRLLQVARPGRTIYLTTGHGERSFDPTSDTDKRLTIRNLRELLQMQSYAVKTLGVVEGLGVDVPPDAAAVAIIGPQQELLPEEVAALLRYLDRGGRLFVALDADQRPDPGQPSGAPVLKDVLGRLGLKFDPTPLANDQAFVQRTRQKSDRGNIATAGFSSHPSVTTLSRAGGRAPMVLVGAGHLEEVKERPQGTAIDFTVRAHGQTFLDANRDFAPDSGEQRKTWELAAAVKRKIPAPLPDEKTDAKKEDKPEAKPDAKKDDKPDAKKKDDKAEAVPDAKPDTKKDDKKKEKKDEPELRAIVLSDSDAVSDGLLGDPLGNPYFVYDGVRWLVGDESIVGEVNTETDAPIAHTRKQDQLWFYACIFLVPAAVLGVGGLMTRRRRMGARSAAPKQKEAA